MKGTNGSTYLFLICIVVLSSMAFPQEKARSLDESHRDYQYKDSPIKIVERRLGSRIFTAGSSLIADNDWIKNLSLSVKNTSDRTIRFISLDLVVRNDGGSPSQFRMPAEFGRPQPVLDSNGSPSGDYIRPELKPGEIGEIPPNPEYYSNLMKRLQKAGLEDVRTLGIDINYVRFDENTIWSRGSYMYRDPSDPKKYVPRKPTGFEEFLSWFGAMGSFTPMLFLNVKWASLRSACSARFGICARASSCRN